MNRKLGLAVVTVAALAGGVGCVSIRYKGYVEAAHPNEPQPFPITVRQEVCLFMMNGTDVLELSGMLGLRDKVCQAGYSRVYYAQREDVRWYVHELRRVHRDDPAARLVLLAYGSAAQRVYQLASDAARDQLPIDAVIFLDPVGLNGNLAETAPFHTVVIRSHNWRGSRDLVGHEAVVLPRVGHFSAPNHPDTVGTVVRMMTASAALVPIDNSAEQLPHLRLRDRAEPTPRPAAPVVWVGPRDEWDFLKPIVPFPCP